MPFDVQNPLINGFRPDYSRISFGLAGNSFQQGIRSIDYSDNVDRSMVRANQQQPLAFTPGEYKAESSMTMLLDEYDDFIERLGGHGFMETPFDIVVVIRKVALGKLKRDVIRVAGFKKNDNSHKQGTEGLEVKIDFDTHYIITNGFNPLKFMRL